MSALRIRTEPLGGSPLARAAIAGAPSVAEWYEPRPLTAAGWRERLRAIGAEQGTGDWSRRLAPALAAEGAAAARLERVVAGGGAVVMTGQQPGLFGGPVYTWSKALSALALADELEAATGVPVAPVFWAATDDADFDEAASTWVATGDGATELALPARDTAGRPMSEVPLGEVDALFAQLVAAAGSAADPMPLAAAREAYHAGATVGDAYVSLLRALLQPLGIAVLDASHPVVREAGDALLRRALRRAADVERALAARTAAIEAHGFTPQVPLVPGLSLVFAREGAGKERVPIARAAEVVEDPSAVLGPNVLLRPVVERAILPAAAYVAGPGEFSYFAQVGVVAEVLEAAAPLGLPRWSCTLVEPGVQALLDRHALDVDELADPHAPERRIAQALLPADVSGTIGALRAAVDDGAARLTAVDLPPLAPPVADGFRRQMQHRIDRLERRLRAAVARREQATMRELAQLRASLYPGGTRQERALNLLPLLARFGRGTLLDMADAARQHARWLVHGEEPIVRVQAAARGLAAAAEAVAADGGAPR